MSDVPNGPGWWQASDGKWYPPEQFSAAVPAASSFAQPTQVGYGYGIAPPRNETLAVVSLVLGIVAIPVLCACGLGFFLGLAAVITGFLGRTKIAESSGALTGAGLALAGIITGAVAMVLGLGYILLFIVSQLI